MNPVELLQRLGASRHIEDLHDALVMVTDEVIATGRKGKVTVTYTIEKVGGEPQVTIDEQISKAPPKRDARGAIAFMLDGEFHARDPRAPELPTFREVQAEKAAARTVTPDEPEARQVAE